MSEQLVAVRPTALNSALSTESSVTAPYKVVPFRKLESDYGIPFCRVHINRLVAAGKFPAPVRLSVNRIVWHHADLVEYLRSRERRAQAA
jgi:predicted DNA-binding transcriptional regulator AlpA